MTQRLVRRRRWVDEWQALRGLGIYTDLEIDHEVGLLREDCIELARELHVTLEDLGIDTHTWSPQGAADVATGLARPQG